MTAAVDMTERRQRELELVDGADMRERDMIPAVESSKAEDSWLVVCKLPT